MALITSAWLSGCVSPVGEEEFTCQSIKKGGVCAGPREIYELTNNRDSLDGLTQEDLNQLNNERQDAYLGESHESISVYKPRDMKRNEIDNYQKAEVIPQIRSESKYQSNRWPSNLEPLAPEPLAVIAQPKVMRVLIVAWNDSDGHLHMPGYTYVEIEEKKWLIGD